MRAGYQPKKIPTAAENANAIRIEASVIATGQPRLWVIVCETPTRGGVDVRGGAPGTRETDLLDPRCMVEVANAVLLTGGSAFGLNAATGVMRVLEERGVGFDVGVARVPIVPAAVLFDLGVGRADVRPDMRIRFGTRIFDILGAIDVEDRGAWLKCPVEERDL